MLATGTSQGPVGTLLHFTESLEERRGTKALLYFLYKVYSCGKTETTTETPSVNRLYLLVKKAFHIFLVRVKKAPALYAGGRAKRLVHLWWSVWYPGENGNPEEDQHLDQMDRVPSRSVFGQSLDGKPLLPLLVLKRKL